MNAPLMLNLSATGNPDFGQYGSMGIPTRKVVVLSLLHAAAMLRDFVDRHHLGSGNIARHCGKVSIAGKVIARVSYNGIVWGPEDWKPGALPMHLYPMTLRQAAQFERDPVRRAIANDMALEAA